MLTFFDILFPSVLPANSNFWRSQRLENSYINNVQQNNREIPLTNRAELPVRETTATRAFLRARGGFSDGISLLSRGMANTSIGLELDISTSRRESLLETVTYDRINLGQPNSTVEFEPSVNANLTAPVPSTYERVIDQCFPFYLSAQYRSGFRVHLADGHLSTTSAIAEMSFSGAMEFNLFAPRFGFSRRMQSDNGWLLDDYNGRVRVRELRLWQNNEGSPYRVAIVSTALWFGQRTGELLGSMIGIPLLMPVAGATIAGTVSGYMTARALSWLIPPDQVLSLGAPDGEMGSGYSSYSLSAPGLQLVEGDISWGVRITRDARLPSMVEAASQDVILPFSFVFNPSRDFVPESVAAIKEAFNAVEFYEILGEPSSGKPAEAIADTDEETETDKAPLASAEEEISMTDSEESLSSLVRGINFSVDVPVEVTVIIPRIPTETEVEAALAQAEALLAQERETQAQVKKDRSKIVF